MHFIQLFHVFGAHLKIFAKAYFIFLGRLLNTKDFGLTCLPTVAGQGQLVSMARTCIYTYMMRL